MRPEILFPFFASVQTLDGVGPKSVPLFAKLKIEKIKDLILTPPTGLVDRRLRPSVQGLEEGTVATVEVTIGAHYPPRNKGGPYRVIVSDEQTDFTVVFFHARDDFIKRTLPAGQKRVLSGKIEIFDGIIQMPHPDHMITRQQADGLPKFEPIYPLTAGLFPKLMRKAVNAALRKSVDLPEWHDVALMKREGWPSWQSAIKLLHNPAAEDNLAADSPLIQRLAYDELLAHQLTLSLARTQMKRGKNEPTIGTGELRAKVLEALPFTPTNAQIRSIEEVQADMQSDVRMLRLLQGDVGAGKTLVAFMAMLIAVEAGGQAALMAPTEILARQHMASLSALAEVAGIRMDILTGRDKSATRRDKLAGLAAGEIDLIVGTHALFQKDVEFNYLRLAVIDEQHRFGVNQRMELSSKGAKGADILTMTATPIPRTLALAQYGDMDISVLDEKPAGRKDIDTRVLSSDKYEAIVTRLKAVITEGTQAYWVCPLVEESELIDLVAAEDRHAALSEALGAENVALVHGQMPAAERDAAMQRFQSGEAGVLVATTVIEVGVDVPNATVMVIEQAERFGLSQLHQLRGRVGRGDKQSSCILLYRGGLGNTAHARLSIMRDTNDGFLIAEEDLKLRGAGDLLGVRQSGIPEYRIANLETNHDLLVIARDDARLIVNKNPELQGERGEALRILLYLMEQERAISYLRSG